MMLSPIIIAVLVLLLLFVKLKNNYSGEDLIQATNNTIASRTKEQVLSTSFSNDENLQQKASVYSSYCYIDDDTENSKGDLGSMIGIRTKESTSQRNLNEKEEGEEGANKNDHHHHHHHHDNCKVYSLDTPIIDNYYDSAANNNISHHWILRSGDGIYQNIIAKVPGDIITDLYNAKIISHPYHDNNFLHDAHVWMGNEPDQNHHGHDDHDHDNTCHTTMRSSNQKNENKNMYMNKNYHIPGLKARERTWIYERNFTIPTMTISKDGCGGWNSQDGHDDSVTRRSKDAHVLIVEGIKMGAMIEINDVFVGNVTNQFKRYIFHISQDHIMNISKCKINDKQPKEITHSIRISFPPDIDTNGRFMACSGGWDWAPYTQNAEASCLSRRVFTFGIVKPIYIAKVSYDYPLIIHVISKTYYLGHDWADGMATSDLNHQYQNQDDLKGDFHLLVDVHLYFPSLEAKWNQWLEGEVLFDAYFLKTEQRVSIKDGYLLKNNVVVVSLSYIVKRKDIQLWWPTGMSGDERSPRLYTLKVKYCHPEQKTMPKWMEKKIGFRHIRLVTTNEYNKGNSTSKEGSGSHGMYFRINNKLIYNRGANVIPMSQLEGAIENRAYRVLVESAVKANMNMLRVWGGGIIPPDSFYEACDEYGVLIYHDLMFVEEQFHSPIVNLEVEEEIRYIIRSLMSHPSIVLWNGCNECERDMNTTNDVYSDFVMKVVGEEDPTRPLWPNSPSHSGWKTGVDRNSGMPNGNMLSYWPETFANSSSIEIHGPYIHGSSLQSAISVNGHPSDVPIDVKMPIVLNHSCSIGPQFENRFVSEFGASVYSSFESMSGTISKPYWSIHGGEADDTCTAVFENLNKCNGTNVMSQRNYPCDNMIVAYFGDDVNLTDKGEEAFRRQLYLCMISQTMWMKGEIEMKRSQNIFGLLIWQLNENWPTGGWGVVEYGAKAGEVGQVIGGRWKPLFYLLERSLYRNVIAACGEEGLCYCRNDGIVGFTGYVSIKVYDIAKSTIIHAEHKYMALNEGSIEYFQVKKLEKKLCCRAVVLRVIENSSDNELMGPNLCLFAPLKHLELPHPEIKVESIMMSLDGIVEITLSTDKMAFYVFLSCQVEGQFEENAFMMEMNERKKIYFIPSPTVQNDYVPNVHLLEETLRIQHLEGTGNQMLEELQ